MRRNAQQVIDEVIADLYMNDASGYVGFAVDRKEVTVAAKKRVERILASLDKKTRDAEIKRLNYEWNDLENFSKLPEEERRMILKKARLEQISVPEAYKASGAVRN